MCDWRELVIKFKSMEGELEIYKELIIEANKTLAEAQLRFIEAERELAELRGDPIDMGD